MDIQLRSDLLLKKNWVRKKFFHKNEFHVKTEKAVASCQDYSGYLYEILSKVYYFDILIIFGAAICNKF